MVADVNNYFNYFLLFFHKKVLDFCLHGGNIATVDKVMTRTIRALGCLLNVAALFKLMPMEGNT